MTVPDAVKEMVKPVPGQPEEKETTLKEVTLDERFYILYYRYGNIPHLNKIFRIRGTLRDAILRGRQHCLSMNYTFILVRPFLVDLDEQERLKREDPDGFQENIIK